MRLGWQYVFQRGKGKRVCWPKQESKQKVNTEGASCSVTSDPTSASTPRCLIIIRKLFFSGVWCLFMMRVRFASIHKKRCSTVVVYSVRSTAGGDSKSYHYAFALGNSASYLHSKPSTRTFHHHFEGTRMSTRHQ